jgi:hypothetical protein
MLKKSSSLLLFVAILSPFLISCQITGTSSEKVSATNVSKDIQNLEREFLLRKDGTVLYEGQIKNGIEHGQGVSYYADNRKKYEGQYKMGKWHGQGTMYLLNGKTYHQGQWADGKPVK